MPIEIPVAVSARHVHLTQDTVDRLFGTGHRLQVRTALSQPGQFAAVETVTLSGPRGRLDGVRIVGPARSQNQVEISRSDEFHLGLDAPVRLSGDLAATPGVTLEGPAGTVQLREGVVVARRHIHMSPADAQRLAVRDRDVVRVAIDSDGRDLVFGDVVVRVDDAYRLELHLDTDEANACGLRHGDRASFLGPATPPETPR
jgi:acetate kinase